MAHSALEDVSASFERGKIHSIIGRSGAGKSTLLRCLNHLETPDRGDILINGHDFLKGDRVQTRTLLRSMGTIFQKFNLLSRRTVLENILLPLEWMWDFSKKESQDKARSLIRQVGLEGLENRYPGQLSGGQCQRVAIARALATDATLLLCDEFTSALDPETSLEILSLLRQINQSLRVTIILITHDMSVVREVSDFVYVMEQGRIVESGELEQVLLRPHHETTQSLLRGLFIKELPNHIQNQLQGEASTEGMSQALIRLIFSGKAAQRPIITDLIREKNVSVNILAGSLDHLRETVFGALLISIPNQGNQVATALNHFETYGVAAEVMGYLPFPSETNLKEDHPHD